MSKALLVARREYLSTVRRKGFIITTLGLPLFFAAFYGIIGAVTVFSMRQSRAKAEAVGLVDESGIILLPLLNTIQSAAQTRATPEQEALAQLQERGRRETRRSEGNLDIRPYKTRAAAHSAFLRKDIRGYYVIPSDYLETGSIQLKIKMGALGSNNQPGWSIVSRLVQASLIEGKLDAGVARRVWTPPSLDSQALDEKGEADKRGPYAEITSFVVPYAFALLFLLSILGSSGYLLQSVAEEKENRVVEILLSSVTPNQLLAGKIFGLGAAGLTQIAAWVIIAVVPSAFMLPFLGLRWSQLFVALIFFPLGFLLFGALMGGTGSLGNNFRESQQASIIWTLSAVSPMFFIPALLAQPNGTLARVLSYIPLTAPITIMMRIGATQVPWWDIALSAGILAVSLFLFVRLAAKLFRPGTLMYGKRPSVVEIVRWLKAA